MLALRGLYLCVFDITNDEQCLCLRYQHGQSLAPPSGRGMLLPLELHPTQTVLVRLSFYCTTSQQTDLVKFPTQRTCISI